MASGQSTPPPPSFNCSMAKTLIVMTSSPHNAKNHPELCFFFGTTRHIYVFCSFFVQTLTLHYLTDGSIVTQFSKNKEMFFVPLVYILKVRGLLSLLQE